MQEIIKILLQIRKELNDSLYLQKEMFSLQQFCVYADISEDQGYKLTSERKIKFYRPGGKKIYIDREDALAYLRQNPVSNDRTTEQEVNNYLLKNKNN